MKKLENARFATELGYEPFEARLVVLWRPDTATRLIWSEDSARELNTSASQLRLSKIFSHLSPESEQLNLLLQHLRGRLQIPLIHSLSSLSVSEAKIRQDSLFSTCKARRSEGCWVVC